MSTPLSLYASRILNEHPLAAWSLEDQADYVSIMSDSDRDLSLWSISSGDCQESVLESPVSGQKVYAVSHTGLEAGIVETIRLDSSDIGSLTSFDATLATFSISTYIYSSTSLIKSAKIGISYNDVSYGSYDVYKKFPLSVSGSWMFLSETFDIPEGISENYQVFIEVEYLTDSLLTPVEFLVSAYSLGQWSEEFSTKSVGIVPEPIPDAIYGIPDGHLAIPVLGSTESSKATGYILTNSSRLFARKLGIPLVYGAGSSISIYENEGLPSIIFPGQGFLNKDGQNKNYSLEFWMRINSSLSEEKRVFGPLASEDGIYVDGAFIKLRIGNSVKSHFVGEWYRPMIVHLCIAEQQVSMLINGETVISIDIDRSTLSFPDLEVDGKSADWLGFFSYEDVSPFEINSVSIYSYLISGSIAKRRWIYGQAVDNPEALNTAYGGKNIFFDYEFSKYSNNYSYPKNGPWDSGIVNNVNVADNRLGIPDYTPPKIVSDGYTEDQILSDNYTEDTDIAYSIVLPQDSSIYFEKLNSLTSRLEAIRGVFSFDSLDEEQCLFAINDPSTGNMLSVTITATEIKYSLKYYGVISLLATAEYEYSGGQFSIGMHLDSMSKHFGNNVSKFLSNRDSLELFVAGGPGVTSFSGNTYSVLLYNDFSYQKIADLFYTTGLSIDIDESTELLEPEQGIYDIASYILKPYMKYGKCYLDIATNSSWTNSIPLSYFAKYVKDSKEFPKYDLDFLQFNVGYPSPGKYVQVEETDVSWTYQELNLKFSRPAQKKYQDLDNYLYTGYADYTDLQHNSRQTYRYDTSSSLVKTYVYFKDISSGMSNSSEYYSNIQTPPKDGIVSPGEEWINTKYEIVDDSIIYPPSGVDFRTTAIFVEVVMSVDGISDKPIAIDKLQFASVSLNDAYGTPVGTRYGIDVYPYTKNGFYYDFKSKNPFSIYRGSTPYLYLNKTSGIRLRGDLSKIESRGIQIPVNPERSQNYKMIALQFFAKFDDDFFPYAPTEIMDIRSKSTHLKIFMEATHPNGARARIYAINAKTGQLENGVGFFVDGNLVKEGVLTIKQWASIGIGFSSFIDFSTNGGYVGITGPLMINNLSHYNSVHLQQLQTTSARPWLKVKEDGMLNFDWEYWQGSFRWFEVLVLASTNFYGVDPSDIYKTYVGTSRVTVDDKSILRTSRYKYKMFSSVVTNNSVINLP